MFADMLHSHRLRRRSSHFLSVHSDAHTMRRWREQSHIYYDTSPVMPPSIIRQNRNNPNFHDILDGSYGVEVVLEREVGTSFEWFKLLRESLSRL